MSACKLSRTMVNRKVIASIILTLWCILAFKILNDLPLPSRATSKVAEDSTTVPSSPDEDVDDFATRKYKEKKKIMRGGGMISVPADDDCLRARNDTVPLSLYRNLPRPYLNLAFPKMGTSTLHHFFDCGGLVSAHFRCPKRVGLCADCVKRSVEDGQLPLTQCGKVDVFAQMDDGKFFPQIELLDEISRGYPRATFFLMFRSMEKWYHSITHWPPRKNPPHLSDRFKMFNITGAPTSNGRRQSRHGEHEMKVSSNCDNSPYALVCGFQLSFTLKIVAVGI